jgi:N-acetylmuramoyl-L-alanine amidase
MRRWVVALVLAAGAAEAGTLDGVEVVRGGGLAVRLRLSAPVAATAHVLPPDGERPARVYLDLPNTTLDATAPAVVTGADPLLRVRTGQFDRSTVRVVLDLASPVPFEVRDGDGAITIELAATPPRPQRSEVEPPKAEQVPAPRAEIAPPRVPFVPARIVVLDAGHGGHDPGATGIGGVFEKTITLDLARRVAARLALRGTLAVTLTRTDDTFVPIDERIARASDAALFVSLHANAAADPGLSGVEIFYGGGGIEAAASGPGSPVRLGLDVSEAIERRLGEVRTVVRPGTFGVLARNTVPSVLVEIGYLTNPGDAARIQDERYRTLVAQAIAEGAAAFLGEPMNLAAR